MLHQIDSLLCMPFPVPGNAKGQLGLLGVLLTVPLVATAPLHHQWWLVALVAGLSCLFIASYLLIGVILMTSPFVMWERFSSLPLFQQTIPYEWFIALCFALGMLVNIFTSPRWPAFNQAKKKPIQPATDNEASPRV